MIQDIGEHRINIVYDGKAVLAESDCIVAFRGRDVYMRKRREGEAEAFLSCKDILPAEYRKEAMERKSAPWYVRFAAI